MAAAPVTDRARQGSAPTGTSRRTLALTFRNGAASAAVGYLVNLALLPYVLHRVGPGLYGAWATIAAFLAVGGLADAGVRTEIVRRVGAAKGAGDDDAVVESVQQGVTLLALLVSAVCGVALVAAPAITAFAFPDGVPGYSPAGVDLAIRATVLLLGVTLVGSAYFGVLRGVQRGDVEASAQAVALLAGAATTVLGIAAGWGLWALFAGSAAQTACTLGWEWAATRRLVPGLRLRLVRLPPRAGRAYLALSGLALLSQISDVVDNQWDKVVLSHFVGSSAVTSFQVGTSLVLQAKALAVIPLAPLLVAVAELRVGDRRRMAATERLIVKVGMVLTSTVLGGLFVFAPAFVRLWLGPLDGTAGSAGLAARLFVVAVALNLVAAPLAFHAFGEGWHRLAAAGAAANMVVNGALSLVLTMAVGFNGALYGSIAGNLAGTAMFLVLMRRRMGADWARPPLGALGVGVVAVAAAIGLGLDGVGSWAGLAVASAGYGAVVVAACLAAERLPLHALTGRVQA